MFTLGYLLNLIIERETIRYTYIPSLLLGAYTSRQKNNKAWLLFNTILMPSRKSPRNYVLFPLTLAHSQTEHSNSREKWCCKDGKNHHTIIPRHLVHFLSPKFFSVLVYWAYKQTDEICWQLNNIIWVF